MVEEIRLRHIGDGRGRRRPGRVACAAMDWAAYVKESSWARGSLSQWERRHSRRGVVLMVEVAGGSKGFAVG